MRVSWLVILLLAGCAGDPSGVDASDAAADGSSQSSQAPGDDAAAGDGAAEPPQGAFEPVTVTWDGTTFVGACAYQGGTGTCAGSPLSDYANDFDVPVGSSNVSVTFTWDDPADRQLNVRLAGAVDEPVFALGASPLTLATPLNGTEILLSASQYVANQAGLQVHSEVAFHAEITFS